jgi:hypothetical protein
MMASSVEVLGQALFCLLSAILKRLVLALVLIWELFALMLFQ